MDWFAPMGCQALLKDAFLQLGKLSNSCASLSHYKGKRLIVGTNLIVMLNRLALTNRMKWLSITPPSAYCLPVIAELGLAHNPIGASGV
jgi:hypothetical protein